MPVFPDLYLRGQGLLNLYCGPLQKANLYNLMAGKRELMAYQVPQ